jgi:glycosidase
MDRLKWWQRAVIYEIAPVSFQDSNGDGKGDLPGLIRRIDYLQWLGVDAVWLTPIYRSPMLDLGYDIADFCAIDPVFGTMQNFERLVDMLHARDMRVILDFVPNHTSDRHPWFQESRASRSNPKRMIRGVRRFQCSNGSLNDPDDTLRLRVGQKLAKRFLGTNSVFDLIYAYPSDVPKSKGLWISTACQFR